MSTARVKTVFPLAVHLGGIRDMGENATFHEIPLSINVVGGIPSGTARGKLHKIFQLDPDGCVSSF